MTIKMTAGDLAREGDAYEEAAEHRIMSWTDNAAERFQSQMVASELMKKAEHCWRNANNLADLNA
ncbi:MULTISPECIES: hypothetical protein [Bradyrhizobium]|uniref:hypothetical protein n=1 Tax=Bradyrhizobium elkanii TaxID=29448 RepID=UPI0004803F96|nr:hypothetical protein [Bradyrhizobium elkanii]